MVSGRTRSGITGERVDDICLQSLKSGNSSHSDKKETLDESILSAVSRLSIVFNSLYQAQSNEYGSVQSIHR